MKVYDVVWRRLTNDGKTFWTKVGVLFQGEDGKVSIKLNLIPATDWDGYLAVTERRKVESSH